MIYNNATSNIKSHILEPFRMCGRYGDDFETTIGGNDENDCMCKLLALTEKHGELVWYSGYVDSNYEDGEYIGN